jgi:hypothetical protein
VSWLIVVGGVIALALAVHVAEQRRSRAVMLARRKQRGAASEAPRFSLSREVRETWAVDLETMRLELSRSDERGSATFLLERGADCVWQMRSMSSPAQAALAVPPSLGGQLEQRYQAYQRVSRSPPTASG